MKFRAYLIIERLACTCWLTNREWTFNVPLWPGRDTDGWFTHSLGLEAYKAESRVLCSRFMSWLYGAR